MVEIIGKMTFKVPIICRLLSLSGMTIYSPEFTSEIFPNPLSLIHPGILQPNHTGRSDVHTPMRPLSHDLVRYCHVRAVSQLQKRIGAARCRAQNAHAAPLSRSATMENRNSGEEWDFFAGVGDETVYFRHRVAGCGSGGVVMGGVIRRCGGDSALPHARS